MLIKMNCVDSLLNLEHYAQVMRSGTKIMLYNSRGTVSVCVYDGEKATEEFKRLMVAIANSDMLFWFSGDEIEA